MNSKVEGNLQETTSRYRAEQIGDNFGSRAEFLAMMAHDDAGKTVKTVVQVDFELKLQEGEVTTKAKLDLATGVVFDILPHPSRPDYQWSRSEIIYMFGHPALAYRVQDGTYKLSDVALAQLRQSAPPEVQESLARNDADALDKRQQQLEVSMSDPKQTEFVDWYERRHELGPEMVFKTVHGDIVKLERRVPGDGTQWYVADRSNGSWCYQDSVIEPGDLAGEPLSATDLDQ